MTNWVAIVVLVATYAISLFLMAGLLRTDRGKLDKFGGVVLLLAPFLGPLLYLFVYSDVPPQREDLQNRGPRGSMTHKWISMRAVEDMRCEKEHEDESTGA